MSEPYSEWYWTWVDHRLLAPVRWLWDNALRPNATLILVTAWVWLVALCALGPQAG